MGNRRTTPRNHGTHACYVLGEWGGDSRNGCRCNLCKTANTIYERDRARRTEPPYVSAGPARDHLAYLAEHGVGLKTAAKAAGISYSAIGKIVYGTPSLGRGPSKRIRPSTAQAILNVTLDDGAPGSRIDATETWRHITTLLGRGWTKAAINRAIGNSSPGLQVRRTTVERGTAIKIKALLDEPVPTNVGKAWSARHRAAAGIKPEPTPEPVRYDVRDRVTLSLVELLEDRIDQNPWRKDAACRGRPPWMFFPARGDHRTLAAAKKICGACFVRSECLAANLDEREGVYGGLSAHERRELRAGVAS